MPLHQQSRSSDSQGVSVSFLKAGICWQRASHAEHPKPPRCCAPTSEQTARTPELTALESRCNTWPLPGVCTFQTFCQATLARTDCDHAAGAGMLAFSRDRWQCSALLRSPLPWWCSPYRLLPHTQGFEHRVTDGGGSRMVQPTGAGASHGSRDRRPTSQRLSHRRSVWRKRRLASTIWDS